ncbi:MAG: dihydroorotate dehydrogenase electron transfer subunit [Deltaproteobacteria bacterium]|nr:dihydroorotate dehydrogenase electron transfer subunit [Deltaproteobacteria bacterium]
MNYLASKVVQVEYPGPGYALIRFRGERPIQGRPGQFVMVRGDWGHDPILPRAFSLVETGKHGAILVRVVGRGTRRLAEMDPGDSISVLGPCGHGFSLPDADIRPILVAGGVGVAPLVFLAERLTAKSKRPVFIYGARTSDDLPLRSRIAAATDLVVTTEDGSLGEKGVVTTPLERILAESERARVFSCGPEGMLKAVALASDEADTPCEVALEAPMACGMGTCKGCAVPTVSSDFTYVCSDGPVFDAMEIYGGAK